MRRASVSQSSKVMLGLPTLATCSTRMVACRARSGTAATSSSPEKVPARYSVRLVGDGAAAGDGAAGGEQPDHRWIGRRGFLRDRLRDEGQECDSHGQGRQAHGREPAVAGRHGDAHAVGP